MTNERLSTTGGYTHAKARKPRALRFQNGDDSAWCSVAYGKRWVHVKLMMLNSSELDRLTAWMQRAAAWCAEGGRR